MAAIYKKDLIEKLNGGFDEAYANGLCHDDVLIIEDSAHTFDNTLNVLKRYSPLIKPGGYFIVEDTICHHGLDVGPSPGPYEAVEAFLEMNPNFESDRSKEPFLITWNPKGYLKRRKYAI